MQSQCGFNLIEIIISLLILSLILLGFDAMQIVALRAIESSYYFTVAMQQVRNLSERLQLRDVIDSRQFISWNNQNQQLLPHGMGRVEGMYPNLKISISWGGESNEECTKNKMGRSGCVILE